MIGGDMFAIKLGLSPPSATARFIIILLVTRIRSLTMIFVPPRIMPHRLSDKLWNKAYDGPRKIDYLRVGPIMELKQAT